MTMNTASLVLFIIAGTCFAAAVYFFIRFNIPRIVGELSGKTARKSIAAMRDKNNNGTPKLYKPSAAAVQRGKITKPITEFSGKISSPETEQINGNSLQVQSIPINNQTEPIGSNSPSTGTLPLNLSTVSPNAQAFPVDNHSNSQITELLNNSSSATEMLNTAAGATEILSGNQNAGGTLPLTNEQSANIGNYATYEKDYQIIQSIVLIHTNETI